MKFNRVRIFLLSSALLCSGLISAQSFEVLPLGVHGGGEENNLSSYLVAEYGHRDYLALDAGTLRAGLEVAQGLGSIEGTAADFLQKNIKGYFISHGHLDHLAGLVINSPDDKGPKNIYGISRTLDILRDKYFTNDSWANFANEGDLPQIGTYVYHRAATGQPFPVENTGFTARIFPLSHVNPYESSAILISNSSGENLLYLGDTGADRVEQSQKLQQLWNAVAPLVKSKSLKALMIEVSFNNERPEQALFGHLTPKLLQEELAQLAQTAGLKNLEGLPVVIVHMKPGGDNIEKIQEQLQAENPLKVRLIFPKQGEKLSF